MTSLTAGTPDDPGVREYMNVTTMVLSLTLQRKVNDLRALYDLPPLPGPDIKARLPLAEAGFPPALCDLLTGAEPGPDLMDAYGLLPLPGENAASAEKDEGTL